MRALKGLLALQALTAAFFLITGLPGRGRPLANAHPDVRGGGDVGFGGSDFYA